MFERDGKGAVATLDRAELATFLDDIPLHEVRLLSGCSHADVRERLDGAATVARPVLALDLAGSTFASLRGSAIAQLARAVRELWPSAWGGEDFDDVRGDALSLAHLPIRLAQLAARLPDLSQVWALDAVVALLHARNPRVASAADVEWQQLALMLSPLGMTVTVRLDPACTADASVAAVEWLAARAKAAVVVLTEAPPPAIPPWTRLLYGTRSLKPAALPPVDRCGDPHPPRVRVEAPAILGAPAVEGRPHPLSAVELRLHRFIQTDPELRSLFGFNIPIRDAALLRATVDLLWRSGRVAVELDGAEHRAAAKYRADRDRDHRLMCAGYRVLRLTNEEVLEDCGRAVEKIREVVRLARPQQPGPERA